MSEIVFKDDTHQYFHNGKEYPSVTTILKHFGMVDFSMVGETTLKKAAEFGRNFHATSAMFEEGTLGAYSPELEPWLDGWKKFLKDFAPVGIAIELPMVSTTWGFAGTPDRVYVMPGPKNAIWDIKTGHEMPANALQTAGYKILAEESLGIKVQERGTIVVHEDGYKMFKHTGTTDDGIFKGLVNAWKWKRNNNLIKGQ
jgi:hypothetical protein